MIVQKEIEKDIDLILWSAHLKEIYRYQKQKFWEIETEQHQQAMRAYNNDIENPKYQRSESVAEHSWHMCDMAMIIGPRFPELDIAKCLKLSILHDKLEIIIGDADPVGNGKGTDTHAYNADRKAQKEQQERETLSLYLQKCNDVIRNEQEELLLDAIELKSVESKFVKALDRLQPLTYILQRKDGVMNDDHFLFTVNYTGKCKEYFPAISLYHDVLIERILNSIAVNRQIDAASLRIK